MQVVKLRPGKNSFTIWFCIGQLSRVRTHCNDDGFCFEALALAILNCVNHNMVVAIESGAAVNYPHARFN